MTATKRKAGRPGKPASHRRRALNITLHPTIRAGLTKLAFKRGLSVSGLLENLAKAELEKHCPKSPANPSAN